jgi:hypothetical protein
LPAKFARRFLKRMRAHLRVDPLSKEELLKKFPKTGIIAAVSDVVQALGGWLSGVAQAWIGWFSSTVRPTDKPTQ